MKLKAYLRAMRATALMLTLALLMVAAVPGIPVAAQQAQGARDLAAGTTVNVWAVQLAPGVNPDAVAASVGVTNRRQLSNLPGYYEFIAPVSRAVSDAALTSSLLATPGVLYVQQQAALALYPRLPTDPYYADQWQLTNTGQSGGTAGEDANVVPAWNAGYTGVDTVVASVDDGLWWDHADIAPNYIAEASYDFYEDDNDTRGGAHGTSVGGIMAAADDGTKCGVGAAYDAQVAGIVYDYTDVGIANSLGYKTDIVDVYNNSWGPSDNGSVLEDIGPLTSAALQAAITTGRGGLGNIYTWAAGNGGTSDNINADGYANDRRVIAVGASTHDGVRSSYSEPGSSMLVNASSAGDGVGTITTDVVGGGGYNGLPDLDCTNSFGGTSSAAPLAAGVVALMLDANPNLTWRDVQWVLVDSADKIDAANTDWITNGGGKQFNHSYGFGRVDAEEATQMASTWVNVPPETSYQSTVVSVNLPIPDGEANAVTSTITVPDNLIVEHVSVVFNGTHPSRGEVHINLTAPSGMVSRLIYGRPDTGDNYTNWEFSSVAHWAEAAAGDWTLSVYDRTADGDNGTFGSWQLLIYGFVPGGAPTATPVATGTPDLTGTPTATPVITETPTVTSTPIAGTELIDNGGFELLGSDGKPNLTPWTIANASSDQGKCNKAGKPPVANTGNCAYRSKGREGENSKLSQIVDLTGLTPA
ncbi:MAG: S8 family serine peptidase, partial [Armatimonadetes bacterium]|nr:S8 family serine peptidase [Anaerolineae bacterium]